MGNAFPLKHGCDVPVIEAIGPLLISTNLDEPPQPIVEFPIYEYPTPNLPSADFGCTLPKVNVTASLCKTPKFDVQVTPDSQRGACFPTFDYNVSFPTGCDCQLATTTNLASLGGTPIIDQVQTKSGDRILVKDQVDQTQNGVYVIGDSTCIELGSSGSGEGISGEYVDVYFEGHLIGLIPISEAGGGGTGWTRDCTLESGLVISVSKGVINGGTSWVVASDNPVTVNSTKVACAQTGCYKLYYILSVQQDYLTCQDTLNTGNTVYIAKPPLLRNTPIWGQGISFTNPQTIPPTPPTFATNQRSVIGINPAAAPPAGYYITYTYPNYLPLSGPPYTSTDGQKRIATRLSDGNQEVQLVVDSYQAGDPIFAMGFETGLLDPANNQIVLQDMNVDARHWAALGW